MSPSNSPETPFVDDDEAVAPKPELNQPHPGVFERSATGMPHGDSPKIAPPLPLPVKPITRHPEGESLDD